MAAGRGGMDVRVFTGGVGEKGSPVRAAAVSGLRFLGVEIDRELNAHVSGDADISAPAAAVATLVVKAHEDIEVAREVRRVLSNPPPPRLRGRDGGRVAEEPETRSRTAVAISRALRRCARP